MLICNCTLAGTLACKSCPEYIRYFGTELPNYTYKIYDWEELLKLAKNYDSDRYELVEKKDWKINNLKQQIEEKSKLYEERHAQAVELKETLELLERELKELETNNE